MTKRRKPIEFLGSSLKDFQNLPQSAQDVFQYALAQAQLSRKADTAKVLKGFGGAGILEVVSRGRGATYRAVYTVRIAKMVYVLHVFQKKSKRGISTPKQDMDLIKKRLKEALRLAGQS